MTAGSGLVENACQQGGEGAKESVPEPAVYVCHCKAVTDRTIDRVIADGARSTREVGRACQAGTECGSCLPEIRRRIRQAEASAVVAPAAK